MPVAASRNVLPILRGRTETVAKPKTAAIPKAKSKDKE